MEDYNLRVICKIWITFILLSNFYLFTAVVVVASVVVVVGAVVVEGTVKKGFLYLTAVFFETGATLTPTKSRNGTNCGSGGSFQSYLTHS